MIREVMDSDLREIAMVEPGVSDDPHYRTILADGNVVAICGYQTVCPGVGQVWISTNPRSTSHALPIIREGKRLVKLAMDTFHLIRIQTTVLGDDWRMHRIMVLVGFIPESIIQCAGPNGSDLIMYRRLRGN